MTEATPSTPTTPKVPAVSSVKSATPEIILFDEAAVSIETMTDLLFEDIGGEEILSLTRSDTVSGQNIIYQPIKNLTSINQQYNPQNLISLQGISSIYFKNYSIKLEDKIPNIGNGPNGSNVYMDSDGNIVVDSINLEPDEQIEIQVLTHGDDFNDTI
jgi:hypothetical protein